MEGLVFTYLTFAIGIVTNALFSSNTKKSFKAVICLVFFVVVIGLGILLSSAEVDVVEDKANIFVLVSRWTSDLLSNSKVAIPIAIVIMIISLLITLYFIYGTTTVNRRRISKILIEATGKASTDSPLKLIAGDLDFLGDLTKDSASKYKIAFLTIFCFIPSIYTELNQYIDCNEQLKQLKRMSFNQIEVLCRRPMKEKDRLMIGLLMSSFDNVIIKFYGTSELKCSRCTNKKVCEACDICENCNKQRNCTKKKTSCIRLLETKIQLCRIQDLGIRGRLFENRTNALRVDIFTKTNSKHKYVNNLFTANDYEAHFYKKLWDTLWYSCREESDILTKCKEKYSEYIEKRR